MNPDTDLELRRLSHGPDNAAVPRGRRDEWMSSKGAAVGPSVSAVVRMYESHMRGHRWRRRAASRPRLPQRSGGVAHRTPRRNCEARPLRQRGSAGIEPAPNGSALLLSSQRESAPRESVSLLVQHDNRCEPDASKKPTGSAADRAGTAGSSPNDWALTAADRPPGQVAGAGPGRCRQHGYSRRCRFRRGGHRGGRDTMSAPFLPNRCGYLTARRGRPPRGEVLDYATTALEIATAAESEGRWLTPAPCRSRIHRPP